MCHKWPMSNLLIGPWHQWASLFGQALLQCRGALHDFSHCTAIASNTQHGTVHGEQILQNTWRSGWMRREADGQGAHLCDAGQRDNPVGHKVPCPGVEVKVMGHHASEQQRACRPCLNRVDTIQGGASGGRGVPGAGTTDSNRTHRHTRRCGGGVCLPWMTLSAPVMRCCRRRLGVRRTAQ